VPPGAHELNTDGGNVKQREQDDEAPMLTDDDSHQELSDDAERPPQRYKITEYDLEAAENLDVDLDSRPLGE
jgi:hypothetical protein